MDKELRAVADAIRGLDPAGVRIAQVVRNALDLVYDGARTGRSRWEQLLKTEKLYFANLLEIGLQREFQFCDGQVFNFQIAGIDVAFAYSPCNRPSIISSEAAGALTLLICVEEGEDPTWSLGLLRPRNEGLVAGSSQDTDCRHGLHTVVWVFREAPIPRTGGRKSRR